MKILLVQPPSNIMLNRRESKRCMPPLGLAYIAGYMRSLGHEVKIYDMIAEGYFKENTFSYDKNFGFYYTENGDYIEYGEWNIVPVLEEFKPDIVGVSCITSQRHFQACNIIRMVKRYNKNIITIIGGNHPSCLPDLVIKDCEDCLDYLVIGEGEYAMREIVLNHVSKGIVDLKFHPNLDDLPFPAHDLLPLTTYQKIWKETQYFNSKGKKYTATSTSRACVNHCEHCNYETVFGKKWRRRSLSNIEEEIKVIKNLGIEEIQLYEYNGFVDKQYMYDVACLMKKYNMQWNVAAGVWIKQLDKNFIYHLKDCGMNCIDLAIESPFEDVINTMPGKDVNIDHVLKIIECCKESNLYTNAFFMIGFPNQTLKQMWNTVIWAKDLNLDTCVFFIDQPLPGTVLWNKIKFIDNFHPFMLRYGKCNIKSDKWTPEQVENIRYQGRRIFIESKNL